jgi:hypothetical protein
MHRFSASISREHAAASRRKEIFMALDDIKLETQASVLMQASPDAVWALLADFERWPEWMPRITKVSHKSGEPAATGSTYEQRTKAGMASAASTFTVVGSEPGRWLSIEQEVHNPGGGYGRGVKVHAPVTEWRLSAEAGGTRLEQRTNLDMHDRKEFGEWGLSGLNPWMLLQKFLLKGMGGKMQDQAQGALDTFVAWATPQLADATGQRKAS